MKKHNLAQKGKRALSMLLVALMVLSCWVWVEPNQLIAEAANETIEKNHFLFAYFTGTSKEGQTIHLAVSEDGYNYTALRNNEPVIIPSKGVGNVRDPYIWYNEQDNYYYILATDLDFTDGGGTYSNNSQSFIIWRSKDLVNWYDETFIDVSKMGHLIGDTRNMSAVWAPQVLWDGSAYVVYFTLACNATSWFDIVYLKTTDLLDPNAYYEFDYILGNSTGNGVCDRYGVIDADIIHNPADNLYYLFYKTECNANELGTTNKGTSLKTIHYYVGDTPTGPFRNPGDTKWTDCGFSIFPNYNVSLEGCNSFWDNDGNLIMYADEFEHTNAAGEAEAYFHIAKSNGTDFTSWSYPDVSQHNINSLSPRHGSVVKITEAEYNRLLNNSYNITSSSYPDTETLEDHLVARFFTTEDGLWNDVLGQPNLNSSSKINMQYDASYGWYAHFDGETNYAEIDFDSLFINGLNYEDGFTITFSALNYPMTSENSENNDRIYEIADVFGSRTGMEHYTHFSPSGGGEGSYLGNYNGPVDSGNDWLSDKDGANRDDSCIHDYIISYATGNVMVYVDGQLVISKNRFTGVKLDASWYEALGSNATMRIGKSGWDSDDPLFNGLMQNLCIYDCSMSYYDAQSMNDDYKEQKGWVEKNTYNGITSAVPTFNSYSTSGADGYYSNILYSLALTGMPEGGGSNPTSGTNPAVVWEDVADCYFGVYYAETTVLLLDGKNSAIMPVFFAGRQNKNDKDRYFYNVYPTDTLGSNADNTEINLKNSAYSNLWKGWTNEPNPSGCLTTGNNQTMGSAKGMSGYYATMEDADSQSGRAVRYYLNSLKVDENNIDFDGKYYKKINLAWQYYGGSSTTYTENDANMKGNKLSDNDIYVINFEPILDLREEITEDMYNEVMNNAELCPELREKYASAVFSIRTLDPNNFGFAEAPETATKACAKAISEAIGTYEGVMAEIAREEAAGSFGHQPTAFEAREATCTQNGLTGGSYCVLCGEILEEQQVIAPLPHTFKDVTVDGVAYKECTVCGVRIEYQASEVRYENLFSLNGWYDSVSNNVFSGTVSTNLTNGTIKIVNQNTKEMYTRSTYDGQNLVAIRDFGCYCIPVTGGKTYVVEATSLASSTSAGDVFVFQYNKEGLVYQAIPAVIGGLAPDETRHLEFTVDANAAYIELRFDANDAGETVTFSQIGIYEKESFDKFGATTADARLGFYPDDDKELCFPNPADGYTFDGWYTKSGMLVENVNQLNNPTTVVYGKWIKAGYNVVYDSIFSFSDWAKSSCNQLWYGDEKDANGNVTRLVSKKGVLADSEKGTITLTNDEDTTYFARTNYWVDSDNVHKMTLEQNTEYILEYTVTSDDGAKPSVCLYITGDTAQYPETGNATRYSTGTHYYRFESGNNTKLTLRFDNIQHGTTATFSNIAVYKSDFEEAARTIENRQYRRYYPTEMGIGDVFEYTPTRPGYTFVNWLADTQAYDENGVLIRDYDNVGDFDMTLLDDTFIVNQNWHLFSEWKENTYNIAYNANGGTGSVTTQNTLYTADVTLASSGFTKPGYKLIGWSTVSNATSAMYQLGQTVNRLNGDPNGTTTLYAVWQANDYAVAYDNVFNLHGFGTNEKVLTASRAHATITYDKAAGTINVKSDETKISPDDIAKVEAGTMTEASLCDVYTSYGTSNGYNMPVKPNTEYYFLYDVVKVAGGHQAYVFSYDSNYSGTALSGTKDVHKSMSTSGETFTTGENTAYIQIRVGTTGDRNAEATFSNIRIIEKSVYDSVVKNVTHSDDYTLHTYSDNGNYTDLATAARPGYNFAGWNTQADGKGEAISTSTAMKPENISVYSQWTKEKFTITYNADGGTCSEATKTYDIADTITIPTATKTGYNFNGWKVTVADGSWAENGMCNAGDTVTGVYGNVTLTAQWTAKTYTILFDTVLDFSKWKTSSANNATIMDVKDNGFTLVSNAGAGEGTTTSPEFPVTAGKQYYINIDVTGSNWDVYIFFYDDNTSSGTGIDFDDGTNRFSDRADNPGVTSRTFTAPAGAVKAVIRLDANGASNSVTFSDIRVYEVGTVKNGVYVPDSNITNIAYNTAVGTIPAPIRDGYTFEGWYNGDTKITSSTTFTGEDEIIYAVSKWTINNSALVADNIVVDFGLPVVFDPVANDAVLLEEIGSGSYTLGLNSSNSKFALNGNIITFTPSAVMNGSETVEYSVTFGGKTLTSTITIAPASNVYYEETFLEFVDSSYIDWSSKGNKTADKYSITENIYGYDEVYDNTDSFSNGTYLQANVRPDDSATTDVKENKSKSAYFTFTGTGFDLISACGKNTGIQTVTVSKVNTDGSETRVKNYLVDTYYATETMLQQVPIVSFRDLGDSATYIVRISASYLKSAAAVKSGTAQIALASSTSDDSAVINASTGKPSEAILDELESLGFDDGGKDVELIWMDEDSTFNGGTGGRLLLSGSAGTYFTDTTGGTTQGLANYIDGFRVYKNGYGNNYIASEQNPTYYNIVGAFANNFISYTADQFKEVFGSAFNYGDYSQTTGPKSEIYLEPGQAIAFKFKADATNGDKAFAMLGMRAVSGSASYKIITTQNSGKLDGTILTATEMYYDLSDIATVDSNGELTILIANTGETGALAVNNLKLVNGVQDAADQVDNGLILGNTSTAPLAPTPVVPDSVQGEAGNAEDIPETDVDTETNVPENDTETEIEDNVDDETENNISVAIPGLPAPIASFLEMLFKFLGQLVGSLGF